MLVLIENGVENGVNTVYKERSEARLYWVFKLTIMSGSNLSS